MTSNRHSTSSSRSSSSISSQNLDAVDSTAPLILVHDPDTSNAPFDISSDTDDDDLQDVQLDAMRRSSIPPLPPITISLFLLSPYLKLGAMLLPNGSLPLKFSIPIVMLFAVLSAFSRHIWYMLAKYLRKSDFEDVIIEVFARGGGNERVRSILRTVVRFGTGMLRILLATVYMQTSVEVLLPLLPDNLLFPTRVTMSVIFTFVILPLSLAQSLASARIIYASWASVATYILWLAFVSFAQARSSLAINVTWSRMSPLWKGPAAAAFAFTSSSTLSLYASLKASMRPQHMSTKTPKSYSFTMLSLTSVAIGTLLILPLVFFSASDPPDEAMSGLQHLIALTFATTLLLSIPSLLVTTPTPPIPFAPRIRISFSRCSSTFLIFALSSVPLHVTVLLRDALLWLALASTYLVPALMHITAHHFKRPLSIVVSSGPPTRGNTTPLQDDLLQRKERALQRRQLRRRIVWDIGVWIVFVGGLAWVVGMWLGAW